MNNIQKAFAAKKQIGIRMADGGPVNSVGDAWNAIAGRIAERGPTLSMAPIQNATNQIRQHVAQTGYPGDGSGPETTPVADAIASIRGRIVERGYPGQPTQAPVVASNAPAQKFADGGRADMRGGGDVEGPGGPREDKVKAWLSDGEFVVNAKAVEKFGVENLEEINEEGLPKGKSTPHEMSEGGIRAANGFSPKDMPMYQSQDERGGDASTARYAASMRSPAPTPANNAGGGTVGGGPTKGWVEPQRPPMASSSGSGLLDATKANFERSSEGIRTANGLGETTGAVVGGAARIAGGVALDAGRALVTNPLTKLYEGGESALRGAGIIDKTPQPAQTQSAVAPQLPSSDSYPDIRGSAADNVAARNAPANAMESSNVKMGIPLDDQRGAATRSVGDLRSWNAPNPIAQGAPRNGGSTLSADEFNVADKNFKAATGGIRAGTTTNLGNFGSSGDIFATKKNGQVSLTGTGDGSAAAEYEKSAQYQDGIRRAAADKALLNELTAKREAGGGQGGGVSVLGSGGGNGGMTMEQTLRATQEAAMGGGMTRGDKNRALQREQIAAQREQAAAQNKTAMFGHQIQDNNNMRSYQSSMFGHEATMRNNQILRQMDERKYQAERGDKRFEQGMSADKYDHQQNRDAQEDNAKANNELHKAVLAQLPMIKGEKGMEPDTNGAARYMNGAQAAVAARIKELTAAGDIKGAANLQALGPAGLSETDKHDLHIGLENMGRHTIRNGQMFGGASGVASNNPLDYLFKGTSTDGKKATLRGGMSMDLNDLTNEEMANRWTGTTFFNPRTNRLIGNTTK